MSIYSRNNLPQNFYIYCYIRKDGTPYYIGKGKGKRAWEKQNHQSVPADENKIVILEANLTEIGALALERRLIRWFGRKDLGTGILINLTDGGEGFTGAKHTEEYKAKMSKQNSGANNPMSVENPNSFPFRKKLSESRKGIFFSEEHKNNLSKALKGYKQELIQCPYCKKSGGITNMKRFHLNNCKSNTRFL